MQQALDGTPHESGSARFRLLDLLELTRRFSGLAAIVILGVAMLSLAFRSDVQPESTRNTAIVTSPPLATDSAIDTRIPDVHITVAPAYRPPEPEIVFYLYDSEAQRQLVQAAESVAGQEAANETVTPIQRQFIALEVTSPVLEQAARDTIFEAMLANGGRTRVIVHDLRGR